MTRLMRHVLAVGVLAAASFVLVVGALGQGDPATPGAAPSASPMASPEASPVTSVRVSIHDFGFAPLEVAIPAGTTVTWVNDGAVIHTTTAKDKAWDSAILESGQSFSYTFTEPGTWEYWCTLHPNMVGTVVVTGS